MFLADQRRHSLRSAARIAGVVAGNTENRTPRIPDPVMAELLRWSFKYVDIFSLDILAARQELDALVARSHELNVYGAGYQHGMIDVIVYERLERYLAARRAAGRLDRCPNSCITRRHPALWKASIAEADALLANPGLPPLQRAALIADNARKRRVIEPLDGGTP
jgi:hypothetical protein